MYWCSRWCSHSTEHTRHISTAATERITVFGELDSNQITADTATMLVILRPEANCSVDVAATIDATGDGLVGHTVRRIDW